MRAVREQLEYSEELCELLAQKSSDFLKSVSEAATMDGIDENVMCDDVTGRALHSFTFQLVSACCGVGGAFWGCIGGV